MSCFCRHESVSLAQLLARLQAPGPPGAGGGAAAGAAEDGAARAVRQAADALASRALPDAPWQPDPAWLDRVKDVPAPCLGPADSATLSSLATFASEAAAAGLDVRRSPQAFARAAATLQARLSALGADALPDPLPWQALAGQAAAARRVEEAARQGLLDPSADTVAAYARPAERPMQVWAPLLRKVKAIAPLLATVTALGETFADAPTLPARLAEAIRALRAVRPPALADPAAMARLLALLSAAASLRDSLGADPGQAGFARLRAAVRERTRAAAALLRSASVGERLPYCPSLIAPAPVIAAATSPAAQVLATIDWKVPAAHAIPALAHGLALAAVLRHVHSALAATPLRPVPCAGCDAAALTRAAAAG